MHHLRSSAGVQVANLAHTCPGTSGSLCRNGVGSGAVTGGGDSVPVGTVLLWAGANDSDIPCGYIECAGQLVSISQYRTLFACIGTRYGGDGVATFKLPFLPMLGSNAAVVRWIIKIA